MARVLIISTYAYWELACCWVSSPSLLLMCTGNEPQVRQDLLPAARDFLLVTARAHPPSSSEAPFPPLQMTNCFAPVEYWQTKPTETKPSCRSSGCRLQFGGAEKRLPAIKLQSSNIFFSVALRAIQQLWFTGKMRCVSFYFEATELPGTANSRYIEASRAPLEWTLDPARPRRGPRGSWSRGVQ
jgi:hypothetical protein